MIDKTNLKELNDELSAAVTNLSSYHILMQNYVNYYENSAFYPRKAGERAQQNILADNYLQIFADKNIDYISEMPEFKILGDPEDRQNANMREKIVYGVHRQSGTELNMIDWAQDMTLKSFAVAETYMDHKTRCMYVRRHDPRHVFWKRSNGSERSVNVFWIVYPITKAEAMAKYGVTPTKETVSSGIVARQDPYFNDMDGQDWFTMAIRLDATTRVAWIGDKMIEEPHDHGLGVIPIDVCAPFFTNDQVQFGSFYLKRLIAMQAELNDTVRRRSNIVKRMSNPIIWGRNIKPKSYDEVKAALKDAETGVLGLGKDGEVGILQLQELKTLYEHEASLKADMQRLSGFASASFGESVGANTSGDALGMYFTPTMKHVGRQQIAIKSFFESINAKILRGYDVFGRDGYKFKLEAYAPRSTVLSGSTGDMYAQSNGSGGSMIQFGREVIDGNYINRANMPSIVPKNEIEDKRLVIEAVRDGFLSRNTGYELWGLESPEDEKQQLLQEKSEPLLNPDGISSLLQNQQQPQLPAGKASAQLPPPPQLAPTRV